MPVVTGTMLVIVAMLVAVTMLMLLGVISELSPLNQKLSQIRRRRRGQRGSQRPKQICNGGKPPPPSARWPPEPGHSHFRSSKA
jgi:hypothetical protein